MTFEQSLTRLEAIVRELEGRDLPLAEALRLFEEGIAHLRTAGSALSQAVPRVQQMAEAAVGGLTTVYRDSAPPCPVTPRPGQARGPLHSCT